MGRNSIVGFPRHSHSGEYACEYVRACVRARARVCTRPHGIIIIHEPMNAQQTTSRMFREYQLGWRRNAEETTSGTIPRRFQDARAAERRGAGLLRYCVARVA